MSSAKLTRRSVLRGTAGATLALPWLEMMAPSHAQAASAVQPPVRMAFFYVPNGVHMPAWRPQGESGPLAELPSILRSLEPVKNSVTVISGLAADHCNGNGAAHEPAGGGFLVGKRCKHSEEPEVGGISVDQLVAREVGLETPVDSLALGIDPGHRGDHGYSGTYMSHISWRNKTTPAALELNPKDLYSRLFRNGFPSSARWRNRDTSTDDSKVRSIDQSILDLVQEETRSLQRNLGYADRQKLADYLEGLRSVERRIASANRSNYSHHQDAFTEDPLLHADEPELPELIIPEGKGVPEIYADHVNLMLDILTLAFQTDTTRVASFMFSYEKSGRSYKEIAAPGSHHSTSHHQGKPENHDELTKINSHHMLLFSRMLQRMASITEGDSSLLDNMMVCYGSGISDGNKHNHDDLPILLAGGAGGQWSGGRHLKLETKTPVCNLYVEMLNQMKIERSAFGDSSKRLDLQRT